MIARLFNAPVNNADDESLGVSTVGSSEGKLILVPSKTAFPELMYQLCFLIPAIILATLAMKRKWQKARKAAGKPSDNPNIVMNSAVQVCSYFPFPRYGSMLSIFYRLGEGCAIPRHRGEICLLHEGSLCHRSQGGARYQQSEILVTGKLTLGCAGCRTL